MRGGKVKETGAGQEEFVAIDVGNTQITLGYFRGGEVTGSWRIRTDPLRTADDYRVVVDHLLLAEGLKRRPVSGAALCSVVPSLTEPFLRLCQSFFGVEALNLEPARQKVIVNRYNKPAEVGADRLANALAARRYYALPAIIVDFGTATTVDAVSAAGAYLGGAIAPGIGISLEALFQKAARLTGVSLEAPTRAIGRTTEESIRSGTVFGFAGQIEGLVARFRQELRGRPTVVATGGLAPLICAHLTCVDAVDEHLTLKGLLEFWRLSRPGGKGGLRGARRRARR